MKRRLFLLAVLAGPMPAWAQLAEPTTAQAELPKEKLTIITHDGQRHVFNVEMALTPEQQTVGEMFRKEVPPDGGMLFDWGAPRESMMWMHNTVAPLDMIFINQDGTIRRIVADAVPYSLATIDSGGAVRATLEVAAGTAKRLNIHAGDKVEQRIFSKPE